MDKLKKLGVDDIGGDDFGFRIFRTVEPFVAEWCVDETAIGFLENLDLGFAKIYPQALYTSVQKMRIY